MNGTDTKVVVGVGEEDLGAALDVAADEAVRAGCPLHLVHAVHLVPTTVEVMTVLPELERHGRALLEAASARAEELVQGAVPVVADLVRGAPASALVDAGRDARMAVLAHRHLSRAARLVERSVMNAVATRLEIPVVAVPTGWLRGGSPLVVAGVDATQDALAAMQAGDLDATVFQDAAGQGAGALDAALKLAKGEKVEKKVYIPFKLVTPANMAEYMKKN